MNEHIELKHDHHAPSSPRDKENPKHSSSTADRLLTMSVGCVGTSKQWWVMRLDDNWRQQIQKTPEKRFSNSSVNVMYNKFE